MECVELAPAFARAERSESAGKPGRTPNASRRSVAALLLRVCRVSVFRNSSLAFGSFQCQIKHKRHSEREEEGVGLQVAGLQEAQQSSDEFGGAVGSADSKAGDDPAVEPGGDGGQEIMGPDEDDFVNLIEVKAVPHCAGQCAQFFRQWVCRRFE